MPEHPRSICSARWRCARGLGLVGVCSTLACIEVNPAHDGLGGSSETNASAEASSDSGVSTDSSAEGMSASADGSSTTSMTTTGNDATGDAATGDGDADEGGDGDGEVETLFHYNDLAECQRPLWCFDADEGIFSPVTASLRAFECFETGLRGPVAIHKFSFEVSANSPQLEDFELQLRSYGNNGPGGVIESQTLNAQVEGQVGSQSVELEWESDDPDFCIGFAATASGLGSALGLAVDETATVPEVSWIRLDNARGDGDDCNMSDDEDVIDIEPIPTGNWCFAVVAGPSAP